MSRRDCGHSRLIERFKDAIRNNIPGAGAGAQVYCPQCQKWVPGEPVWQKAVEGVEKDKERLKELGGRTYVRR